MVDDLPARPWVVWNAEENKKTKKLKNSKNTACFVCGLGLSIMPASRAAISPSTRGSLALELSGDSAESAGSQAIGTSRSSSAKGFAAFPIVAVEAGATAGVHGFIRES